MRRPSGRNCGQDCLVSPAAVSIAVTGVGAPPDAGARISGLPLPREYTITPPAFQVPPSPPVARSLANSQTVAGEPPETLIFLTLSSAKNPMNWLSGDQKGSVA